MHPLRRLILGTITGGGGGGGGGSSSANPIGVNVDEQATASWNPLPIFVDAMRNARPFQPTSFAAGNYYSVGAGTLDANGWPTTDTGVTLVEGAATAESWVPGAWTLTYTATNQATLTATSGGTITGHTFSAGVGAFTFNATGGANVQFTVTGIATGIKNLTARRPGEAGLSGAFRQEAINLYKQFGWLRFMWFMGGWQDITTTTWASRPTKTNWRTGCDPYVPGQKMPVELAVEFAVACGVDLYLTIPVNATLDYWTNLAIYLLATLLAGQRVHLEYGNELWNNAGQAKTVCIANANANPPGNLNFDGINNVNYQSARWAAWQTYNIWQAFSAVFGAAINRVRMILAWQMNADSAFQTMRYINSPLGMNIPQAGSFLYALSFAPYTTIDNSSYGGTNDSTNPSLTVPQILASMTLNQANILTWSQAESVAMMAMRQGMAGRVVCYEGGPSLASGYIVGNANAVAAGMDPGIQAVVYDGVSKIFDAGATGYTYFEGGCENDPSYGAAFTLSQTRAALADGSAPKLKGLAQMFGGRPAAVRNVVSGSGSVIDGRASADKYATGAFPTLSGGYGAGPDFESTSYKAYLVNCSAAGTYTLHVNVTTTSTGSTDLLTNNGTGDLLVASGLALPNTAGVQTDVALHSITLVAGVNYIRLGTASQQSTVQINSLRFV